MTPLPLDERHFDRFMVWGKRYIGVPLFRQIGSTDKSTATGRFCGRVLQRREMGFR
ncbi:MAG: hypothetical protein L7T24_10750 [Luminiphilus sp.]|nr:hypothetical protein [Luminiphilus sp.]